MSHKRIIFLNIYVTANTYSEVSAPYNFKLVFYHNWTIRTKKYKLEENHP